jgi:hypothetical protein
MAYLLLCDAIVWDRLPGSVPTFFQSPSAFFTSGFLPRFLVGFLPFFLCLK